MGAVVEIWFESLIPFLLKDSHIVHCEGHIVHGKEKQCPRVAKLWSVQWSPMKDFAKTSANAIIVMYFLF